MDGVVVRAIVEMLGSPPDHLKMTLEEYVKTLPKEGVELLKSEFAEPSEVSPKTYSIFAELDIKFATPQKLLSFCFDALPSSIDIIEPRKLTVETENFASFINDLLAQLHTVNKNYAVLNNKMQTVDKNGVNVLRNFISYLISTELRTPSKMSDKVGMPATSVQAFLDAMEKDGLVKKKGEEYYLP